MGTRTLTMTSADVLAYQSELVRKAQYFSLGRANKISIGPNAAYTPPPGDLYIAKYGRLIELRDRFIPIAQSPDKSMILVTAPLLDRAGRVSLPDVPDPGWVAGTPTKEEIEGREEVDPVSGAKRLVPYTNPERIKPRMIAQRLEDRTSEKLEGTNFWVFQPVLSIAFQPEIEKRLTSDAWILEFKPDGAGVHCALLVDPQTGETHFFGGLYDIFGPRGGR